MKFPDVFVLIPRPLLPPPRFPSSHQNLLGVPRRSRLPYFFPSLWPSGPSPWDCPCPPTCSDRQGLRTMIPWSALVRLEKSACEVSSRRSACIRARPSRQRHPRETKKASYSQDTGTRRLAYSVPPARFVALSRDHFTIAAL